MSANVVSASLSPFKPEKKIIDGLASLSDDEKEILTMFAGEMTNDGAGLDYLLVAVVETRDLSELEVVLDLGPLAALEAVVLELNPVVGQHHANRLGETWTSNLHSILASDSKVGNLVDHLGSERRLQEDRISGRGKILSVVIERTREGNVVNTLPRENVEVGDCVRPGEESAKQSGKKTAAAACKHRFPCGKRSCLRCSTSARPYSCSICAKKKSI